MIAPIEIVQQSDPTTLWIGGISAVFTAMSAVAALVTVLTASRASRKSLAQFENMQNKFVEAQASAKQSSNLNRSIQTVLHCNMRYHDLEKERLNPENFSTENFAERFAIRYWSLKSDQFDYWLAGFVDPDAFTTWFSSVARHFTSPESFVDTHDFRDLWIDVGRSYHQSINPWFVTFIDYLEQIYPKDYPEDREFGQLDRAISALEGVDENNKGFTWKFREEFQKGLTHSKYLEFQKNKNLVDHLPVPPWNGYSPSNEHPTRNIQNLSAGAPRIAIRNVRRSKNTLK